MKQTEMFITALKERHPEIDVVVKEIRTKGDIDTSTPLEEMGGFGAFVRELNNSLLADEIDVSVNSLKDMPVLAQDGILMAAVLPRGPVNDVILPCPLEDLPHGATVGTSSVRRAAMVKRHRPDLKTATIRGNVGTRVRKLREGLYDAIILAQAGLERLGMEAGHPLPLHMFPCAPGQGAIGLACRSDDADTIAILNDINDRDTYDAVTMERSLMRSLGADCSAPVGIHVQLTEGGMRILALALSKEGDDHREVDTIVANGDEQAIGRITDHLMEVFR